MGPQRRTPGTVTGGGREVLVLTADGLISVDYMFPGL
jgi:hypothetical protein